MKSKTLEKCMMILLPLFLMVYLPAQAAEETTTLKVQTHLSAESLNGKNAAQFKEDVEAMSNGRLKIDLSYSGAIVKGAETFDAVANGLLDGDMTTAGYQTGKNPAFQFLGDIMGGYNTPWEQYSWLYFGRKDCPWGYLASIC